MVNRPPEAFSSAQLRSLMAVSAHRGSASEAVVRNTWDNTGDFYVRVRGRNGAFDVSTPFHLQVALLSQGHVTGIVGGNRLLQRDSECFGE